MYLATASTAAAAIATLTQNLWQKRTSLLGADRPIAYFCFRLSISDSAHIEGDTSRPSDVHVYVHFVLEQERWYYTLSEQDSYKIDHNTLRFVDDDDAPEWEIRGQSWRHYAFSDLLEDFLERHLSGLMATLQKPGRVFLDHTFPLESFRGTTVTDYVA